jgi:predicted polyphosphate/ATP-dependent NAD kinase
VPGTVGIVVNPVAGKDIRRLVSGAGHTSDTTKMGIVRRVVAGAAESGASRIMLADDPHRLARRAVDRLELPDGVEIDLLSDHVSGSRRDTIGAVEQFRDRGVGVVVALGGDGTCRDVATGWADAPLIAISTGTNNVYPSSIDGTSAGVAAGLVASGSVPVERVAQPTKRIVVQVTHADGTTFGDVALVDVALVDATFVGARAVRDPRSVLAILAAIGRPASTGLSSVAGRLHPIDRFTRGGVLVRTTRDGGEAVRSVRVPLSPGLFDDLHVCEVRPLDDDESVELRGPGVLAFDGERDLPLADGDLVTARVERTGPLLIDVDATTTLAAHARAFDRVEASKEGHAH